MNADQYKNMSDYFAENKIRSTTIKTLHDILPALMYVFYPLQLFYLLFTKGFVNEQFLRFTFVPLGVLIAISILRIIINAPRPYEKFDYTPVVRKATKGKSFPSRHTTCAFIIAMAFLYLDIRLGVVMLIIATLIGFTRIFSAVHFIRDVIWGAIIGILSGVLFFFII